MEQTNGQMEKAVIFTNEQPKKAFQKVVDVRGMGKK